MTKLKGILLTQGMHGMISQVEGLAKALDLDFVHHKVELNNFWKIVPPKLTPISQNVYQKINESDFDVIISCGRKNVNILSVPINVNPPTRESRLIESMFDYVLKSIKTIFRIFVIYLHDTKNFFI